MIIKCGTCDKEMGEKGDLEDKRTTHSICPECSEKERKGSEKKLKELNRRFSENNTKEPKFPMK